MEAHAAERRHLNRQVTLARPIFLVLAMVDLLNLERRGADRPAILFVGIYLAVAILLAVLENLGRGVTVPLPLTVEFLALAFFLFLTPSLPAFWFLALFVVFATATQRGLRSGITLAAGVTLGLLVRSAIREPAHWPNVISWLGLAGGSFAAGAGIGFLGARERQYIGEQNYLQHITGLLRVERGMAESIRAVLEELRQAFSAEQALLVFRDDDLERIFVWRVREGDVGPIRPADVQLARADSYLLDDLNSSLAWNSLKGAGEGFGWNRHDGRRLAELPRVSQATREALGLRSLMTTVLEFAGQPAGRVWVCNGQQRFTAQNLRWLGRIVSRLGPPLENLFLLRHLRAQAIEGERGRISRDLHDGVLQTLLSLAIQLDVLRQRVPQGSDHVSGELSRLQQTVRKEGEELRRMVTDMRPVRVQSAELWELMNGFAELFRRESQMALDLFVDSREPQLSDRVCRELFQIYREALNNVKKHARASHVVVKLSQQEGKVSLVVDDNGQGFSFAGRFGSDELDRLRLGPISIKERTRAIGGTLTVESTPGHGARLTVDIPLS